MKNISELKQILGQQLNWHKARIDFFSQALIGLFLGKSINFREIAIFMPSPASVDSRYKRIQRFFSGFEINFDIIAQWLFSLFFNSDDKIYIAIDRTNWFRGKSKINIFMLCICYEGIAIPIFWRLLNKAGNSTGQEQIELLEQFTRLFGKHQIKGVLADREFPNAQFIAWLQQNNIAFYMRVKHDAMVHIKRKKYKTAGEIFNCLGRREHKIFNMRITIFQQQYLFLAASKNEKDELMIIVTNDTPKVAIATYLRRWEIECFFQALKQRGFQLESTHVTNLDRLEKVIGLLAIAFCWAHKVGEWQAIKKPIRLKSIKKQKRPQASFFKYGLDFMRDCMSSLKSNIKSMREILSHLIPKSSQLEAVV